jgi:hypothetical protein
MTKARRRQFPPFPAAAAIFVAKINCTCYAFFGAGSPFFQHFDFVSNKHMHMIISSPVENQPSRFPLAAARKTTRRMNPYFAG